MSGDVTSFVPWLFAAAIIVTVARLVPRVTRDLSGPLPDIGTAPDDAEPMAVILPNDDGLFTSSLRFPEQPAAPRRDDDPTTTPSAEGRRP
jgi:hypothetical protein